MRTALSRMVANGETTRIDSRYELTGRLLDRQRAQDTGRRSSAHEWDERWHTIVPAADQRHVAERRRFRSMMADHRFGELRPDIWIRPGNLDRPPLEPTWIYTNGELDGIDPATLGRTALEPRLAGIDRPLVVAPPGSTRGADRLGRPAIDPDGVHPFGDRPPVPAQRPVAAATADTGRLATRRPASPVRRVRAIDTRRCCGRFCARPDDRRRVRRQEIRGSPWLPWCWHHRMRHDGRLSTTTVGRRTPSTSQTEGSHSGDQRHRQRGHAHQ